MKNIYLKTVFAALLLLCSIVVTAEEISVNGINYNIDVNSKTAFVIKGGEKYTGNFTIPSEFTYNGTAYSVTAIGEEAFRDCTELTSVVIPYGINNIQARTFYGCTNLKSVYIPGSVTRISERAFSDCTALASIELPAGLTYIGDDAFSNCTSLEGEIILPNGITEIRKGIFSNCKKLTSITVPNGIKIITDFAFQNCSNLTKVSLPNGVEEIGTYAFAGCEKLTDFTLPDSLTKIGGFSFADCHSLTSIKIPEGITIIEPFSFDGCIGAKELQLPSKLTSIKHGGFGRCSSLTTITIPQGVTTIEQYAFSDCNNLESITIPSSVATIGNNAFNNCEALKEVNINDIGAWCKIDFEGDRSNPTFYTQALHLNGDKITEVIIPEDITAIKNSVFLFCNSITSVTIPTSVTSIGSSAFHSCTGLTSIEIPNSVTSIEDDAFNGCTGLTSVIIPEGVTNLGAGVFRNCKIASAVIPSTLTSIGFWAFDGCHNLESVTSYISAEDLFPIGTDIFSPFSNIGGRCILYVPAGTKSTYEATEGWNCFLEIIELDSNEENKNLVDLGACGDNLTCAIDTVENKLFISGTGKMYDYNYNGAPWYNYREKITSVYINDGATTMGNHAFYSCYNLTSINIPNSVTTIGSYAFFSCENLTSVTIPNSVIAIGNLAFSDCENLLDVYCLATTVPSTRTDAFEYSYPEYATLHVPAEAINSYRTTEPWSSFGTIVAIDEDVEEPEILKCATPVLSYTNGTLSLACDTEGVEFITKITDSDIATHYTSSIELTVTYNISAYATKEGYENSDTINATLCWIDTAPAMENITSDVNEIKSTPMLISGNGGLFTISSAAEGTVVSVYTASGILAGEGTITNGSATVETSVEKGEMVIISAGGKSVKVIAQ